MNCRITHFATLFVAILFCLFHVSLPSSAFAASCTNVVRQLNRQLPLKINEQELVMLLKALNESDNEILPAKFVTKNQAQHAGWRPGKDLWSYPKLEGKSIGGDIFGNHEGKLPKGNRVWREADLDYRGGHRGSKRILYSSDGLRRVTVDHYQTFIEVPACE